MKAYFYFTKNIKSSRYKKIKTRKKILLVFFFVIKIFLDITWINQLIFFIFCNEAKSN